MNRPYTLLTGCTGLLGRYLLRDLLAEDIPVAVLVRPRPPASATDRVDSLLASWDNELGGELPRPVTLAGDVTEPDMGLDGASKRWIALNCERVLHSAASLEFRGPNQFQEPWLSNFTGVQRVAKFCRTANIRELHHISTAYVCGTRSGTVYEWEGNVGQRFRNDYEECKLAAEEWLRDHSGLDVTVYRPAVIVGDSRTGYTSTYHGLYRFFQFTWLLRQQARLGDDGRWHNPVRLRLTGKERGNVVPVDWVSAAIVRLMLREGNTGKTYHLAPEEATNTAAVEAAAAKYFNYHGVSFVGPEGLPDGSMTDRERMFYDCICAYEIYLHTEPVFDLTNTRAALPDYPCPRVDLAMMQCLIEFGVRDRWGKSSPSVRKRPVALAQTTGR